MKFQAVATLLLAGLAFSDTAMGYASRNLHRRALAPLASNVPRSPYVANAAMAPAPTPLALLPRQDNNGPGGAIEAPLTLTSVAANDTTIAVTRTSTAPSPTGTAAALGGIAAPSITMTNDPDRPFSVNGDTFTSQEEALNRACAIQHNMCADAVNDGTLANIADVSDCDNQQDTCDATATT